jgi:hypothetical protein
LASWREIDSLRKDPTAFRALAKRLLKLPNEDFTDWEKLFLDDMAFSRKAVTEFTTRQSEKLLQIRDDAELVTTYRGFSVKALLKGCHEGRPDLDAADEAWIADTYARNAQSIKRRHIGRLMRCARALNLIDTDIAA